MSDHNPWPDGIVNAADLPEPEPRTALARWDSAEISTGRQVQPLVEDQSRFCLHSTSDHGFLGCNVCGCPRSEDDHLGELCRWPGPEEAGSREPWLWRPGMHMDRFPHGMAFGPKSIDRQQFRPWVGSIADLMGDPRANISLLYALDAEGNKPEDDPLELIGPFHMRHEDGRMAEFIAWGGVHQDPLDRVRVTEARGVRLTKYNADGTLGETTYLPDARVVINLGEAEEESPLQRLARNWGPPVAQLAITFTETVGPACRALLDLLTGRTGKVPPCKGLTRRQRAARRRIPRRKTR